MQFMNDRERWPAGNVETPRAEPEIIPPGEPWRRPENLGRNFEGQAEWRVYQARIPRWGIVLVLLAVAAVAVLLLLLLLGFVLIWVPVVAVLVAAALATGFVRSYWQRLRHRWNVPARR
jgi:hypothetical protein